MPNVLLPFLAAGNSMNAMKIAKQLQNLLNLAWAFQWRILLMEKVFRSKYC
jgi:hypothetical protein